MIQKMRSARRHWGRGVLSGAAAGCLLAPHASAQTFWSHFARNEARAGLDGELGAVTVNVVSPLWIASTDDAGRAITFNGQSGPVVDREHVYALGRSGGVSRVFALRRADGLCVWSAPVPNPVTDSWSTPALDPAAGAIIIGAGNRVLSLDARTGLTQWSVTLNRNVVNASPLVAPTVPRRIFVTDADGFGMSGRLYCINADRFDAALNPFQPGQLLWSTVVGGTSGNSPAFADGRVIVATVGEFGFSPGSVLAFDASAIVSHPPLWTFENVEPTGFFGGVSIRGGSVYAATYAFSGGQTAGNLVKLDANDGSLVWSVPCNRTDATPIVLPDGRVVLSGGLAGFGASPSVQVFQDQGALASMQWDSALATWNDTNSNGVRDSGEYLSIGGWTHQPAAFAHAGGPRLMVGTLPSGSGTSAPCTHARIVDLSLAPDSPSFVVATFSGAGSTPAIVGPSAYTIGATGLHAFGPAFDVNGDGMIDIEDLHAWESPSAPAASRDVDRDGDVDATDRNALIEDLRRDEQHDMMGPAGRRGTR